MGNKIYYLLKILTEHHHLISYQIIQILESDYSLTSNKKEIIKLVKIINDFFLLLMQKKYILSKKSYGYYVIEGFFEDGQIQLLLDSVIFNKDASYQDKKLLIDKIRQLSSLIQLNRLTVNHVESSQNHSLLLNLSNIIHAIDQNKNISFKYVDYKIENHHPIEVSSKDYLVSPYKIIIDNNHYYLIGYYHKRKDMLSTYRIDRMRRVMSASRSHYIDITEQYDLDEYIKSFNMFINGKETDFVFIFHESLMRETVSRFGESINLTKLKDHYYKAIVSDLKITAGLKFWAMMMGSKLQVIAPDSLREDIVRELKESIAHYE